MMYSKKLILTTAEFDEFSDLAAYIFDHTSPNDDLANFRELHARVVRDRRIGASEVSDYDLSRYNFLCGGYGYSLREADEALGNRFLLLHELFMAERLIYDELERRTPLDFLEEARTIVNALRGT